MTHRSLAALLGTSLALSLAGCPAPRVPTSGPPAAGDGLRIHFFSLGQADSMLVIGPGPDRRTLLIDLGEDRWGDRRNYERVARRIESLTGRRQVDQFLVSHYHADHIGDVDDRGPKRSTGGLFGLMEDPLVPFHIGTLLDRGDETAPYTHPTGPHKDLLGHVPGWLAAGRLGERRTVHLGRGSIDLGEDVDVDIVAVNGRFAPGAPSVMERVAAANPGLYQRAPANENDFSVALILRYGDFELFTGGDLTGAAAHEPGQPYAAFSVRTFGDDNVTYTNVESPLATYLEQQGTEADVEFYRADHHGSGHSSVADLTDRLDPEFVVASTGGQYGHPEAEIVRRLSQTARFLITSGIAKKTWPAGLTVPEARVMGEITVRVAPGGRRYAVNGERHRAYTDAEEKGPPMPQGTGRDVSEEKRGWKRVRGSPLPPPDAPGG